MKKSIKISTTAVITMGLVFSASALAERYYGSYLCGYPGFKCVKVHRGDTWEKLFHDPRDREVVKRLNRMNMPVQYRSYIIVPTNLNQIKNVDLSPLPAHQATGGQKLILVDLGKQAFGAYDSSGNLVHWGPVSAGKGYCPDLGGPCSTVTGNFKIFRKQGPECVSSKFPLETNGGAPMPYCMHFSGGYALHGSTLPGYHASHGCVRLFFEDAKWLNQSFANIGTRITIRH